MVERRNRCRQNVSLTGGSTNVLQSKPHCVVEGEIGAHRLQTASITARNSNSGYLKVERVSCFQGGGGVDGFVAPAVGEYPRTHLYRYASADAPGYAVVSMDGVHPHAHAQLRRRPAGAFRLRLPVHGKSNRRCQAFDSKDVCRCAETQLFHGLLQRRT